MPKVIEVDKHVYEYTCSCGTTVRLHTDMRPKKIFKCFKCLEKKFNFEEKSLDD